MMSVFSKALACGVAGAAMSLAAPSAVLACIPPRSLTAAEEDAGDRQVQAELWARHDMIFAVIVTAVGAEDTDELDAGGPPQVSVSDSIRVRLEPIVIVKGEHALPAPYEIRDIWVGCFPSRGIERAQVGQRYLIYGRPSQELDRAGGIVEIVRLKESQTIRAVYQASALAALTP